MKFLVDFLIGIAPYYGHCAILTLVCAGLAVYNYPPSEVSVDMSVEEVKTHRSAARWSMYCTSVAVGFGLVTAASAVTTLVLRYAN